MTTQLHVEGISQPSLAVLGQLQRERDLYATGLGEMTQRYEQKIQELSVLRRVLEVLRDCTELDEVFRRLLAIVQEELSTLACSLYLADDSGELVLRARCTADGPVEILRRRDSGACRIPAGSGPLGETFATGKVLVMPFISDETPGWFPPEGRALLTAPLGPENACMGILALHAREVGDVSEDATRLLPLLANQATIAIENAALYRRIKQHSDTLEARVRERTAALEHLNAELQAASQQKLRFFAHFSHELRTPLNSILGFSDMLRTQMSGPLNERQERYVRHVHDSGTRLLRLITDILDLAKVEAGKLSLQTHPMALLPTIEQALAVMQPQADSKHVQLAHSVPEELACVQADPARVHQVLLNLLSNAIKFTPEGGSVTVSAAPRRSAPQSPETGAPTYEEAGGQFVEVSVRDTGIGIALEDQQRLFRDFEQATGGEQQGTGLGLSLTRRLVVLHGGTVGLESVPGQGSRFWFTLPMAVPEG